MTGVQTCALPILNDIAAKKSAPRVLILGLDGVGHDLLGRFAAEGVCPNLAALADRGALGPLASTVPPTTFPAWTSFFTGARPSSHGVGDFTVREGYRVRFVGARDRALPTLLAHLEACGLTASAAWFPVTYPPERLRGYQIAGWDSPVTHRGDATFVHPPALHRELAAAFGGDHLAFSVVDEFADTDGWYREAAAGLVRRVERRAQIARYLLARHPTDVAAFYFGEADTAAHHFWAFHDPTSPRRPAEVPPELAGALAGVYRALDAAVGDLVDAAGAGAAVVVLSDHGSGGAADVALHLNRALADAGLLRFAPPRTAAPGPRALRSALPRLVPRGLRRTLFRLGGGVAPAAAESYARFAGIDWAGTRAFSEELTYAPSVWINQLGREPRGRVRFRDREAVLRAAADCLADLTLDDGRALVRRAIPREELHAGPLAHRFPDLVIELDEVDGHTPVCLPSEGRSGPAVSRLAGDELLGRKGRSMPGCHTPFGDRKSVV